MAVQREMWGGGQGLLQMQPLLGGRCTHTAIAIGEGGSVGKNSAGTAGQFVSLAKDLPGFIIPVQKSIRKRLAFWSCDSRENPQYSVHCLWGLAWLLGFEEAQGRLQREESGKWQTVQLVVPAPEKSEDTEKDWLRKRLQGENRRRSLQFAAVKTLYKWTSEQLSHYNIKPVPNWRLGSSIWNSDPFSFC